jgi:hypothetical protein
VLWFANSRPNSLAQMTGLKDMVNAVDDTIGNAIKAVDKMASE